MPDLTPLPESHAAVPAAPGAAAPDNPVRILVSTGEVSGDVAGALAAAAILRLEPAARLFGIGGPRLAAAGVEIVRQTNHLGSVGFTETFGALPALASALRSLVREVRRRRPQAALLIGNDLFNCLLARLLRRWGVRTVAYFPPQVWLWRSQAKAIAASYDLLLTSFPEEQEVYARAGGRARFVGHYLCERLRPADDESRRAARAALGLEGGEGPVVALLPGSRTLELAKLGPILFEAGALLAGRHAGLRFVVPAAEARYVPEIERLLARHELPQARVVEGHGTAALAAADLALMASGTASLEAALLGTPMVLTYRLSPVTFAAVRLLLRWGWVHEETVGLPNLILGRRVVPELRQDRATAEELAAAASELVADAGRRQAMRAELARVAPLLERPGTLTEVAAGVLAVASGRCEAADASAAAGEPRWASS